MPTRRLVLLSCLLLAVVFCACTRNEPATPPAGGTAMTRLEAAQRTDAFKSGHPGHGQPSAPGGFFVPGWQLDGTYFTRVDMRTGVGSLLQPLDTSVGFLFGLTFDLDGTCYAFPAFGPQAASNTSVLAKVDPVTGAMTPINGDSPYDLIFAGPDIDSHGNLFVTGFTVGPPEDPENFQWYGGSSLWRVDKATGALTEIGDTGNGEWMDLAFDSHDRLWTTARNELWTLDTQTGEATFVTDIHGVPQADLPGDGCPEDWQWMEVMTLAFDQRDVLYAAAMRGFSSCLEFINTPVMRIDTHTGQATVIGYLQTGGQCHGGDIMPTAVRICHRSRGDHFVPMTIPLSALPAHRAHGDFVPGVDPGDCGCDRERGQ